jgi:hypothetical protein
VLGRSGGGGLGDGAGAVLGGGTLLVGAAGEVGELLGCGLRLLTCGRGLGGELCLLAGVRLRLEPFVVGRRGTVGLLLGVALCSFALLELGAGELEPLPRGRLGLFAGRCRMAGDLLRLRPCPARLCGQRGLLLG